MERFGKHIVLVILIVVFIALIAPDVYGYVSETLSTAGIEATAPYMSGGAIRADEICSKYGLTAYSVASGYRDMMPTIGGSGHKYGVVRLGEKALYGCPSDSVESVVRKMSEDGFTDVRVLKRGPVRNHIDRTHNVY